MNRVLLLASLAMAITAHADIYRCVGADGSTTFSQSPCSDTAEKIAVNRGSRSSALSSSSENADCSYAADFARVSSRLMRAGADKDRVFKEFGGRGAFDDGAARIVDYVFKYQNAKHVTEDRIAELASGQCGAGNFGGLNCDALPAAYTDKGGGCGESFSAQHAYYSVDTFAVHRERSEARRQATAERMREQAERNRKRSAELDRGDQCAEPIRREIDDIQMRIRAGSDPNGHRHNLQRLKKKLAKCGPRRAEPYEPTPPQPGGYCRIHGC